MEMKKTATIGLAIVGLLGFALVPMTGVTGASTAGISTNFVGATTTETPITSGPSQVVIGSAWQFTAVGLGPSPALALLSVTFAESSASFASFTLNDLKGDVVAGLAQCLFLCNSTGLGGENLAGAVTSGTGSYSGLLGHLVDLKFTVAKGLGMGSVAPSLFVGKLTVS
ncbi:MAG TPA: hypothetical protein VG298_10860 [Acidimicrobiales bacterium]|nr:hypothetical protein [Acidimicrobiales bacterium]